MPQVNNSQVFYHSWIVYAPNGMSEETFKEAGAKVQAVLKDYEKTGMRIDRWVFQLERGAQAGKLHYQGYSHCADKWNGSSGRMRASQCGKWWRDMFKEAGFEGVSVNAGICSNQGKGALRKYCMKEDTREGGPWATHKVYNGIDLLQVRNDPHKWQTTCNAEAAEEWTQENDRTINWIFEKVGCVGKSKWVKDGIFRKDFGYVEAGSARQLCSSIVNMGAKKVYVIDRPRTKAASDSDMDFFNVVERLKNGCIQNVMHGKGTVLLMEPPRVFVFGNSPPPANYKEILSADKWKIREIVKDGVHAAGHQDYGLVEWVPPVDPAVDAPGAMMQPGGIPLVD